MLSVAKPWTYWMALPILIGSVLVLLGFGAVYLKRVVEPNVRRLDALAAARSRPAVGVGGGGRLLPGNAWPRVPARHRAPAG